MPLAGVAATGDRRATLEALRDLLAAAIDDTESGRDLAALALRLTDVLNEIDKDQNQVMHIYDAKTGKDVRTFLGKDHNPKHVAFTRDGKWLAVFCDYFDIQAKKAMTSIHVWSPLTGEELEVIQWPPRGSTGG